MGFTGQGPGQDGRGHGASCRLPPLKVRDLRLDLEQTISFSDKLLETQMV